MNRMQRRSLRKTKQPKRPQQSATAMSAAKAQEVVDNLPLPAVVSGINNLLSQLEARGVPVLDWDDHGRALYRLQMRRGNIFFLAAGPDGAEKAEPEKED